MSLHESVSKSDLGSLDWRMMLSNVPRLTGLCSGTGTETVLDSLRFCINLWLPFCRTLVNPCFCKIRQISSPERTRSLPNGNLNLRHKNFAVEAARDLRVFCYLKEQRKSFDKV